MYIIPFFASLDYENINSLFAHAISELKNFKHSAQKIDSIEKCLSGARGGDAQ